MKRAISVLSICLLATFVASTSLAMSRAKKAEKPACTCPEGKCICGETAEAKLPCGCKVGECKCATEKK